MPFHVSLYSLRLLVHQSVYSVAFFVGLRTKLLIQACIQHISSLQKYILFTPLSPMALAFHFYAQVYLCKIRNFKNECQLTASAAWWYYVWLCQTRHLYTGKYYSLNLCRLLKKLLSRKLSCVFNLFVSRTLLISHGFFWLILPQLFEKKKKKSRSFHFAASVFFLPQARYMWHCKRGSEDPTQKIVSVQICVMSVFTLFDCPWNISFGPGNGFFFSFCEDGILIYVKSFKLSLDRKSVV